MMSSLNFDQHFKKAFRRYLKKQGRINFQLKEMVQLLKIPAHFKLFQSILQQTTTVTWTFKVLILLNRYLIEVHENQKDILQIINLLKWKCSNQFQQLLFKRLVQPYRFYLQKRSISGLNSNEFRSNDLSKDIKTYQLINLLCLSTSFTDILYIFGRYYLSKLGCIIDFNITLGVDLQYVYRIMVDCISRPASRNILQEIEIIHEKLYVVFYNCYFHKYLKNYIPKWVITDIAFQSPRKSSSNISTRSNFHVKQKRILSFQRCKSLSKADLRPKKAAKIQDLGQSYLFLNENIDQNIENVQDEEQMNSISLEQASKKQQGLKLLFSMQRYVEQLRSIE